MEVLLIIFFIAVFLLPPIAITFGNIYFLFNLFPQGRAERIRLMCESLTFLLGIPLTLLLLSLNDISTCGWEVQLRNSQLHSPISPDFFLPILLLCCIFAVSYLILRFIPIDKIPPLVIVTAISGLYIGIVLSILFIIQISPIYSYLNLYLLLFPANCIILSIALEKSVIIQFQILRQTSESSFKNPILKGCNQLLSDSFNWPWISLIIAVPLLLVCVIILVLFGQEPDSFIKAFTDTSDWALSQQISPQNIYYDGHYLCTVAAGGHKKIVKPIRKGLRHGHPVIVNRQLQIANAFEQILQERLPEAHRVIRNFYDKYGFPLAKIIKSPFIADIIYILMKPLEWIFLAVIYSSDPKPENRISMQYTK